MSKFFTYEERLELQKFLKENGIESIKILFNINFLFWRQNYKKYLYNHWFSDIYILRVKFILVINKFKILSLQKF